LKNIHQTPTKKQNRGEREEVKHKGKEVRWDRRNRTEISIGGRACVKSDYKSGKATVERRAKCWTVQEIRGINNGIIK